jgi:PAS domain S-box-containing protein
MNFDPYQGLARSLFEESEESLFLFDPDTELILDANSAAQRLTGFLLRDLLRLSVDQLFQALPKQMEQMLASFRRTEVLRSHPGYEICSVQPNQWIPVSLSVARLHVQSRTFVLVTARDLREQLQMATCLDNVEAERSQILEASPHALWSAEVGDNAQLVYHWFSPAVERLTGQPPGFFLSGSNRWWSLVAPPDQPGWERFLARLLTGQSGVLEYRLVRVDGSIHRVRETVVAFPQKGQPTRLYGTITDLTEPKTSELCA